MSRVSSFAALLCCAVLAGCGGSSQVVGDNGDNSNQSSRQFQGGQGPQGGGPGGMNTADMKKLQSCLKKQGVELPDRGSGSPPGGAGAGSIDRSAMEACSQYMPSGGPPGAAP